MNAPAKEMRVPELYSIEAEQAVLGAVIGSPSEFWKASELVGPDEFYDPLHARIWKAIAAIMERDGALSTPTLYAALGADEGLASVGGAEYLQGLTYSAPATSRAKAHCAVIADFARRRRIVEAASDAIDKAYFDREASADSIADQGGEALYEAGHSLEIGKGPEPIGDVVRRAATMAETARRNPEKARVSTGMASVDRALGGLFPRDLTVLAAAPNIGKSGLSAQIAMCAARAGYVTLFQSKEMSSEELAMRFLACESGVPSNRIAEGRISQSESEKIAEAAFMFDDLPFRLDGSSYLTVAQIRARAQATKRKLGSLALVVIDHLRFIKPADRRASEPEQLQQITRDLKAMAKDLDTALLLVAHLNRDFWKRQSHRPIVSDLYGSSAIEQNADHIWFLHREEFYLERDEPPVTDQKAHDEWDRKSLAAKGEAELFGAKRRGGPLGTAKLKFDAPFVRFTDPNEDEMPAQEGFL